MALRSLIALGENSTAVSAWPTEIHGLGRVRVVAFDACEDCPVGLERGPHGSVSRRRGVWTFYGDTPLCRFHAWERTQTEADDHSDHD